MKLYLFKVTTDDEPSMLFIAAESVVEALHALQDEDLGETDWESVTGYLNADKRPKTARGLADIPEDYHDHIFLGENPNGDTVSEFFEE
jgi:hypothetical protein